MDNLARKLDDTPLNNDSSSKSNIIYLNPHQKRIEEIRKTKDALLDIRLKLSMSKFLSDKISVKELNKILEEQKDKEKDELVSKEIDELFKDIIPINKDINKEVIESTINKELEKKNSLLEELENQNNDEYKEDSSVEKGNSKRLNNGHYKPEKKVEE